MKKFLFVCIVFLFVGCFFNFVCANEEIQFQPTKKVTIQYNTQVKKDVKNLVLDDEQTIKDIVELQRTKDAQDLEYLWKCTIDSSNLVKFALKKLAIPESQRRLHSSIMAKSMSAIISGAAYLPMLMGQNMVIQSASFSASRIATGLLTKSETPQTTLLTDTEMIELAGMIEKLQTDLLNSYYNYKNALVQLKNVRARIVLANKNYYDAMKTGNATELLVSSNLYDNLLIEEMQIKQKIWCYQLQLQKLAGADCIKKLNLYQYALNNELLGKEVKNK